MWSLPLIRSKHRFFRNRNYISWSRQVKLAVISISDPSWFSFIPSLCPSDGTVVRLPFTPAVYGCETVSTWGHWSSAALLARVEVNKPHRAWLKEFIHSSHVVLEQKQCITLRMLPLGNVRKCTVTHTVLCLSFEKTSDQQMHWFTAKPTGEQNVHSDAY